MAHFYAHATHLILQVLDHQNSVKAIVSAQCSPPRYTLGDQKRYLATVINVLAWKDALSTVLDNSGIKAFKDGQKSLSLVWKKYCSSEASSSVGSKHLQPQAAKNAINMLLLVLTHDLIVSPSKRLSLSANHPAAQLMAANKARLQAELVRLQIKMGKSRADQLRSDAIDEEDDDGTEWFGKSEGKYRRGRWIRVNTRVTSTQSVVSWLQSQGFTQSTSGMIPISHDGANKKHYTKQYFLPDPSSSTHPPDLILLPIEATPLLVATDIYKQGHIILQDAASCWPAWVLLGQATSSSSSFVSGPLRVLDATASPGNKTTHLSALLRQSSAQDAQVYALERDDRRFTVLVDGLKRARCLQTGTQKDNSTGLVQPMKMDFLATDPTEAPWNEITHMLLDPSCSGSGIVGRLDWLTAKVGPSSEEQEVETEEDAGQDNQASRLQKLSDVQVRMIEHAFQYPSLTQLVYSTCSIHAIEDEQVVQRALASPHATGTSVRPDPKFAQSNNKRKRSRKVQSHFRWQVVPREKVLPGWQWRGRNGDDGQDANTDAMLRAHPYARIESTQPAGVHPFRTNGFFACAFERVWLQEGEEVEEMEAEGGDKVDIEHTKATQTSRVPSQPQSQSQSQSQSSRARKRQRQKANATSKAAE